MLAIKAGDWSELIYVALVSLTYAVGAAQLVFRWLWADDIYESDPNPRRGRWRRYAVKTWAAATAATAFAIATTVYHFKQAPLTFWLLMPLLVVLVSKAGASVVSWIAYRIEHEEDQRHNHERHDGGS